MTVFTIEIDPAIIAKLQRIAQGGNRVWTNLPNTGPLTRDQMAGLAIEALALLHTSAVSSEDRG